MAAEASPGSGFEVRLGHQFADRRLLEAAWTHRSGAHELDLETDYERLEFLGDSVLGLLVAEWLFRRFPELAEGDLARLKSRLVAADALAAYAVFLDLGSELFLGQGEERSGGREKQSLLADSMEAVFAAVYLDAGLGAARRAVLRFLEFSTERMDVATNDAKSSLQEELQARGLEVPRYRVACESGPDHAKVFEVEVLIAGRVAGRGRGRTKKAAERVAARRALEKRAWRQGS